MAAVVIAGASVAGLASALALSGQGHDIVVLERGPRPPEGPYGEVVGDWHRPLVPQAAHSHTLAALGVKVLRERAPRVLAALREAGAVELDLTAALPPTVADREPRADDAELTALGCRRGTLDLVLERTVRALPDVRIAYGDGVRALRLDPDGRRVAAVVTAGGPLRADVVIDATGRRAESRRWLTAAGVPVADDETAPSGLSVFSRFHRLRPGARPGPLGRGNAAGILGRHYAGLLHPGEHGTFGVLIGALPGDQTLAALGDPERFAAVARLTPGLAPWLEQADPVSPVHTMTAPHNALRGPATTRQRPVAGLFAVGDAVCVTDPLYGRGVSLALAGAFRLADLLASAPAVDIALSRRVARSNEALYGPWFRQSVDDDRIRIAQWRAAIAGRPAPSVPTALGGRPLLSEACAAAASDGEVWRGLTRMLMGLRTREQVFDDAQFRARVRRAPAIGTSTHLLAPGRAELARALASYDARRRFDRAA
ncbi:hypothetical protein [Streptomyces sp. ICBB 8177]|uniref:FAD-dependent oxidoreductase n=1 Tax=Streptomyces sp. ICBB 8177 TaxID=563922 RepID=UPI000D67F0E1|nr:hypothetical protein [Streptomyces sp. ICBB 8177]PWI42511.1 hypothetical protein CK485_09180 [Streptomyces sp. ICBB 8177]